MAVKERTLCADESIRLHRVLGVDRRRMLLEPGSHSFPEPDSHSIRTLSHTSRFSNKKILDETKNESSHAPSPPSIHLDGQCIKRFACLSRSEEHTSELQS